MAGFFFQIFFAIPATLMGYSVHITAEGAVQRMFHSKWNQLQSEKGGKAVNADRLAQILRGIWASVTGKDGICHW